MRIDSSTYLVANPSRHDHSVHTSTPNRRSRSAQVNEGVAFTRMNETLQKALTIRDTIIAARVKATRARTRSLYDCFTGIGGCDAIFAARIVPRGTGSIAFNRKTGVRSRDTVVAARVIPSRTTAIANNGLRWWRRHCRT